MARFDTAGNIISAAALELGLGAIPSNDPFASQDPVVQQLCGLFGTAGRLLATRHEWENLIVFAEVLVASGDTGDYDLPSDFVNMVDRTAWDEGKRLPLIGPLSPEQWQYLRVWMNSAFFYIGYRLTNTQLRIFPQPPPVGAKVSLEYRSSSWVIPAAKVSGQYETLGPNGIDRPVVAGDLCLIDPILLNRALKLEFLKARGFDTTAAREDFDAALELALDTATEPPTLKLSVGSGGRFDAPLLGPSNIPITGVGGGS
jgi:hypothetical protein